MDIVFMGTPEFAVPALEALNRRHNVLAVITQPDKPRGRGKKLTPPPVKSFALENNIAVYQPQKIRDSAFIDELKKIKADIFTVAAYGQILPESILNMPQLGCVNIHPSLLPKYRGAAPIQRAVINGEKETGVTIMYMEKGLDSGDMILKEKTAIGENETFGELQDRLSVMGAELLIRALDSLESKPAAEKQDDSLACYAHMIDKETEHICWENPAESIRCLIRGLNPTPAAYTLYNDEPLKIYEAELSDLNCDGKPGEIVKIHPKKGIYVKTGTSVLLITRVKAKGGKLMPAPDYLRGRHLDEGIILL